MWNVILPKNDLFFITVNMTISRQKESGRGNKTKKQHEENTLSNKIQQTQSRSIGVWCLYRLCVFEGGGQTHTGAVHCLKAAQL